jgi:hypothetical protein
LDYVLLSAGPFAGAEAASRYGLMEVDAAGDAAGTRIIFLIAVPARPAGRADLE